VKSVCHSWLGTVVLSLKASAALDRLAQEARQIGAVFLGEFGGHHGHHGADMGISNPKSDSRFLGGVKSQLNGEQTIASSQPSGSPAPIPVVREITIEPRRLTGRQDEGQ